MSRNRPRSTDNGQGVERHRDQWSRDRPRRRTEVVDIGHDGSANPHRALDHARSIVHARRTLDSTTPASTLDSSDGWVWFVTERGLRASGATSMKAAAAELRQTAAELEKASRRLKQEMPAPSNGSSTTSDGTTPPQVFRRSTVCGQYRNQHQVPALRLAGKWLRQAGFDLGQKVAVKVDQRRLTICAE